MLPLPATRPRPAPACPPAGRAGLGLERAASLRSTASLELPEAAPACLGRRNSISLPCRAVCASRAADAAPSTAAPLAPEEGASAAPAELLARAGSAEHPGADLGPSASGSVMELLDRLTSAGVWLEDAEQLERLAQEPAAIQTDRPPATQIQTQAPKRGKDPKKREDFYANVGEAIRTLRAEIPLLFQEDLTYDIYRDDITFRDPRNAFHGKKDYKTIFWSLRFHGKLFFRCLYVDVLRIWESPENVSDAGTVLKMRWSVHGVPRVPWDAEGIFDGISTFKLDSAGKIYEHAVDNIILKDPPKQGSPFLAGLNLLPLPQPRQQPCPGAWFGHGPQAGGEDGERAGPAAG